MPKYNPEKHHRHSIRYKGYDYSQAGAYFLTICTKDHACLCGDIIDGQLLLSDSGRMITTWWAEIENKFTNVKIDEFVVMPNHFHGIIIIVGADLCVCPENDDIEKGEHAGSPLPRIVQWFKTMTTNEYIRNVKQNNWPPFNGKLWQRNYYDHVMRNEDELNRIREYIINNPLKWTEDENNPANIKMNSSCRGEVSLP